VRAVQRNPALDEVGRSRILRRIYERTAQDDAALLEDLGFLVTPDPRLHQHRPLLPADSSLASMHRLLRLLCRADKTFYRPGTPGRPADMLAQAASALHDLDPEIAEGVDRCLASMAPQSA
jgi:hypothetical protein